MLRGSRAGDGRPSLYFEEMQNFHGVGWTLSDHDHGDAPVPPRLGESSTAAAATLRRRRRSLQNGRRTPEWYVMWAALVEVLLTGRSCAHWWRHGAEDAHAWLMICAIDATERASG